MEFFCAFLGEFRPVHLKLYIYVRGTNDYNFNFDGNRMELLIQCYLSFLFYLFSLFLCCVGSLF